MARIKKTVTQRAFPFMETREDFLERDDLEARQQALRGALNMKALATQTIEARPGLRKVRAAGMADDIIEIRPTSGLKFGLIIKDASLEVVDATGDLVFEHTSVTWDDTDEVWVTPMRKKTIIGSGSGGIHELNYDKGVWSFGNFAFSSAPGGELAQPYWAYEQAVTIKPSGLNGNILVEASTPIWVEAYVGQRIRYGLREIEITHRISGSVVRGTVVNELPPSFRIAVENSTEYRVGDAVVGADTNFQGVVLGIDGLNLDVVTQSFYEGPDVGEELSAPNSTSSGTSKVTAVTTIPPLSSPIWDEPLMSPLRGYPRAAAGVSSRLVFLDFESIPDLIALSSSRSINDFDVGTEDDDAIVRQVGNGAPRWLHALDIGDLILFSDSGIYNVPTRENGVISPTTFNPVFIDETGCSEIKPVKFGEGAVFVDSSGENVAAVVLDGNIYLKWSVRSITTYHKHLVKSPRRLCGPSLDSREVEKFVLIINGDGTIAAVSWQSSLKDETVGFTPWETQGRFVSVAPIFGGYWAIVERDFASTVRFFEAFDETLVLDCASIGEDLSIPMELDANGEGLTVNGEPLLVGTPSTMHLAGETVDYYIEGWDAGSFEVNDDGTITDEPDVAGVRQVGLNFRCSVKPWPIEIIESERAGSLKARVMELNVSVQNTHGYEVVCNGVVNKVGAYHFGDDLTAPPKARTEVRHFTVFGNRDHPDLEVRRVRPGKFRILALGQKVQA
ncbi:hypothetical protein GCM10011360_17470 [Primorskyibacter flagellatus]|uniref:Uncharacterized protein n=1 Tax=Primorskyibacter flagellatus TaxID=1387277 RepID=A0A917A5Z5_9RHOB|nr:hypothetical protein [Primorskyibacter flagellatus]GGE29911.1 hypothetical protein GCM10011360_17470 [Primorskyibacter flagellatus]